MAVFLGLMAVWHILEGTLFPDAIFFAIVGVLSLIFAMIGIEAESGFEMGEGEGK